MPPTLPSEREFFAFADEVVAVSKEVLRDATTERRTENWIIKPDGSPAEREDVELDKRISRRARERFPGLYCVSEEGNPWVRKSNSIVIDPLDGASYLREGLFMESSESAGGGSIVIDPLDGTSYLREGLLECCAVSVGLLHEGRPVAGVVVQPYLDRAYRVYRGKGVHYRDNQGWWRFDKNDRQASRRRRIGTDFAFSKAPSLEYQEEAIILTKNFTKKTYNFPAVTGGIAVLVGLCRYWWSHTAHLWDLVAVACMVEEMGGVAESLYGGPISWDVIQIPPVILAESSDAAKKVRRELGGG